MAILGWLFLIMCCAFITFIYVFMAMNNLGTFNIGGVPNSTTKKVVTIIVGLIIGYAWYCLFAASPFILSMRMF